MGKSSQQWVKYKDSALKSLGEKRYDVAESSLIAALNECVDFKATDARNILTIEKLAECYWCLGRFDQAIDYCEELVGLYEKNESLSRADWLAFLIDLAMLRHVSGDINGAEVAYKKAIKLADKLLGKNHMYSNKIRSLFADLLVAKGSDREATLLGVSPKVVTIRDWIPSKTLKLPTEDEEQSRVEQATTGANKKVVLLSLGQPDAEAVYQSNNESAKKAEREGKFSFADKLYQINLQILQKFGVEGQTYAQTLESISAIKQKQGLLSEAIEFYQSAHDVKVNELGKVHPVVAYSFGQLANLYYQLPAYEGAESMARKCAEMYEKIHGKEHPEVACAIHNLATLYHVQRKYEHAEGAYKKALDIKNVVFGPEHPETKRLMNSYAELLSQTSVPATTDNGDTQPQRDEQHPGMITGSWKVMQVEDSESLMASNEDACDICGANLEGNTICGACGFDTSAGI